MEEPRNLPSVQFLSVPSVQELASKLKASDLVPERYIRPEFEADNIVDANTFELPVVDMGRLLNPHFSKDEISKLDHACEHWGFFQLINHGIPDKVMEQIKIDTEEFFKLPLEKKKAIAHVPNRLEGFGQHYVMSEDQKLDWGDMLFLATNPTHTRDFKFWPSQPPTFRESISEYSAEIKRITIHLLEAMAKGLRLEPEIFMRHFKEVQQTMRFNQYPPCPQAKKVMGFSPHSDGGCLTLLLQVNDVPGLQIRKNGNWIAVHPIPGAIVVNVGDTIEVLTNGKYRSIEHRVAINTEKERFSIATFHLSSIGINIGPISELVGDGIIRYKTMLYEEFMKEYFASKLGGKNRLERMKI